MAQFPNAKLQNFVIVIVIKMLSDKDNFSNKFTLKDSILFVKKEYQQDATI